MNVTYLWKKIYCKLFRLNGKRSCDLINEYFRKSGILIGRDCRIYSDISSSEAYLIVIGNSVTISNDVQIITHDNSVIKVISNCTDVFGPVKIGDNSFIGARTIILPGVEIGDNCVIGAGSVVTKSIPAGSVAAGNPIRIITNIDDYKKRMGDKVFDIDGLSIAEKKSLINRNPNKWIRK